MTRPEATGAGDRVGWQTKHGMRFGVVLEVRRKWATVRSRGQRIEIEIDRLYTAPGKVKNGGTE